MLGQRKGGNEGLLYTNANPPPLLRIPPTLVDINQKIDIHIHLDLSWYICTQV